MSRDDIPRRKVLKYTGITGIAGLAGCISSVGDSSVNDDGQSEKPWETDELAQLAKDEGETDLMWYNTGGAQDIDADIMDFINSEFGDGDFDIDNLLAKDQRVLQELQSGNVSADCMKAAEEARELGLEDVAVTLEDKLAIAEDAPDWAFENRQLEWKAGGAAYSLIYNTDMTTDEQVQLLEEKQWNALLEEPFEGVKVVQDYTPKLKYVGAVLESYSEEAGMEPKEWLSAIQENCDFSFSDGHSSGVRIVGQGSAQLQFLGYPNHILEFGEEGKGLPVETQLPPEDDIVDFHSQRSIVPKDAPHQMGGLFLASAVMEPKVQQFIANETPYRPGRVDLDYPDAHPFKQKLLTAVGEDAKVSIEEQEEYEDLAEEAFKDVFGSPSPDY